MSGTIKFNRKYKLSIDTKKQHLKQEPPEEEVEQSSSGGGLQEGAGDFLSVNTGVEVLVVEDLHIEATVTYSKDTKLAPTSPARIDIYNMSKTSRDMLATESVVILEAGYDTQDTLKTIYSGQIVRHGTKRDGNNIVTTLLCDGTYTVRKNLRVSKSWPPNTTYKTIIDDLLLDCASYGISTGVVDTEPQEGTTNAPNGVQDRTSVKLVKGYAVDGYLLNELAEVCNQVGLRCYFAGGALLVEPIEFSKLLDVVEITGESTKGNIFPYTDSSKSLSGSSSNKGGFNVTLPLEGGISITNKAQISTKEIDALCDIVSVSHRLSYYGDVWNTELKLLEI